jgi:hypothetical protein
LACVLAPCLAHANGEARTLAWPDLAPPTARFEDPFLALKPGQLADLAQLARYRERQQRGEALQEEAAGQLAELTRSLESQNVDIDGLLARREEIKQKRLAAAEAVDTSLNSRRVRMPGFLLPLNFDGTKVTEFLLVPTVGACIHVPPPPPNQMVHVTFADGFETRGLYTPVWVEGTMAVGGGETELFLKDGAADVAFGYQIKAVDVVNYNE